MECNQCQLRCSHVNLYTLQDYRPSSESALVGLEDKANNVIKTNSVPKICSGSLFAVVVEESCDDANLQVMTQTYLTTALEKSSREPWNEQLIPQKSANNIFNLHSRNQTVQYTRLIEQHKHIMETNLQK